VEALQPRRSLSHSPLFQVMFALQNAPESKLAANGFTLEGLDVSRTTSQFDLTLSVQESREASGETLTGNVEYATALFERETVERFIEYWQRILEGMTEEGQQAPVAALPLLGEEEQKRILCDFNETAAPYPQEKLIHELFEEQAAQTPGAIAVAYENTSLSYGELNARANR
jgi:non-ribosomal peptide synthetase component F